jgi:hypothetical protein
MRVLRVIVYQVLSKRSIFKNDHHRIFTNASDAQRQLSFPIVDCKKDLNRSSGLMYNNVSSSQLPVVKTVVFSVFKPRQNME